ncbi:MAG: hypothetical protein GY854_19255 [Deltaproteobacteria bacterium]|nr:hypothetical protein [Deltaproteobacteria bacterium]
MSASSVKLTCPHCNSELLPFEMPPELAWGEIQHACFNNDCSYFKEGWHWLWEHYEIKSSYRYRVTDVETGAASPLMVWSEDALRDRIIKDNG